MKVYVYGTGCGAGDLIDTALPLEQVSGFVDSRPASETFLGKPVLSPEDLAQKNYDLVIVTSRHTEEIALRCEAAGIDETRLLFLKNHVTLIDRNQSYAAADELLGTAFVENLRSAQVPVPVPPWAGTGPLEKTDLENDYVRVRTLEALCARLQDVPGAVAELGVYRGSFARCINLLLPDRMLYLFDTFAGFRQEEAEGYGEGFIGAHRNTTLEDVRKQLPYPEKAVFRQGFFPETAVGLEESFALVSLDVDLEESTYAGLCWFLPRLERGGYLLLHDYNDPALPGVRNAVARYEEETGKCLSAVPVCDRNGSLVICG